MRDRTIFALDLGRMAGFAAGRAGEKPRSGTIRLAKNGAGREIVLGNLIAFLDREFRAEKPGVLMKEAPLALEGFKTLGMGEPVVRMTYALHGVTEAVCARFAVPWHEEVDSRIRKHFIGKGRLGSREATKRAVLSRCWQLGYLPRGCNEEDRADALAAWDWAAAHLAKVPPKELILFGEGEVATP